MTKASTRPHPLVGRTDQWWGVINEHGKISEVHQMRAFATGSLSVRGDGGKCMLARVEVKITEIVEKGK